MTFELIFRQSEKHNSTKYEKHNSQVSMLGESGTSLTFWFGHNKRRLSLSWLNAEHTNLLRENQTHDVQNNWATLGQLKKKKSINKCLTPPRSSWGKSPGSRKSPSVPLLLCRRIYSKQMWLWSGGQNSLVLSLEVLLDEAVLGPGLLGRNRIGTRHLVSSAGTLQHKGRSPWTQRRVRVLSKYCDVALKIISPDKVREALSWCVRSSLRSGSFYFSNKFTFRGDREDWPHTTLTPTNPPPVCCLLSVQLQQRGWP